MNMTHTTIETRDGWTRMVYHGTCVAEKRETRYLDPKDPRACIIIRLNTGGYFTKTTKKRMNQFAEMFNLPYRVCQIKGDWFADFPGTDSVPKRFSGDSCEFNVEF